MTKRTTEIKAKGARSIILERKGRLSLAIKTRHDLLMVIGDARDIILKELKAAGALRGYKCLWFSAEGSYYKDIYVTKNERPGDDEQVYKVSFAETIRVY